jgi:hypothetical protein
MLLLKEGRGPDRWCEGMDVRGEKGEKGERRED